MQGKGRALFTGVEDTLVIETAVKLTSGQAVERPTLRDYCARVDKLINQELGNLYVVRGYMLHPHADPALMIESKRYVTDDPDGDLVRLLEYAAKKRVYTMTIYTGMTKRVVSALKRRCGRFYLGNNLGEITMSKVPPGQKDMRSAAEAWVKNIRNQVQQAWKIGQPHVTCTLTNLYAQYCLEAGMDIPTAEIFTLPCVDVQFALLRGAMRGYGKKMFGGWLATGWFSGSNLNPKKQKHWELVLKSGFLHGANFLIQESGHWGLYEFRDTEDANHPLARAYRRIQKQFYCFARANLRPADGPQVRIGLVHGRFDGYSGLRGDIWGQPGWNTGEHEDSWELLKIFYPESWNVNSWKEILDDRYSRFSGTPYGLVDIVPAMTPAKMLSRYRSLLFLGWNTMCNEQYLNLIKYVRKGGRLVMWASHLNRSANRNDIHVRHDFYNNGDFRNLFGVSVSIPRKKATQGKTWNPRAYYVNRIKWVEPGICRFPVGKTYYNNYPHGGVESKLMKNVRVLAVTELGVPFVTERKLGRGYAVLVNSCSPQGHGNFREFAEDIFHAVGRREQPDFRIQGNPKISYAVYGAGQKQQLYALNTDYSKPARATVIGLSKGQRQIRFAPAEMKCMNWE